MYLILKTLYEIVRFDQPLELSAPLRVDVNDLADIGHATGELLGRAVTVHACQRRIDTDVPSIRRSLENPLDRVFKYVPILLFRLTQRFLGAFAFGNIMHRTEHPPGLAR